MLTEQDVTVLKLALERSALDAQKYVRVIEALQKGERLGLAMREVGVEGPVVGKLVAAVNAAAGQPIARCDAEDQLVRRALLTGNHVAPDKIDEAEKDTRALSQQGQFRGLDEALVNRGWLALPLAIAVREKVRERLATCSDCFRHYLLGPGQARARCAGCDRPVKAGQGRSAFEACSQLLSESQQAVTDARHSSGRRPALARDPAPPSGPMKRPATPAAPASASGTAASAPAASTSAASTTRPGTGRVGATSSPATGSHPRPSTRVPAVVPLPGLPGVPRPGVAPSGSSHDDEALVTAHDLGRDDTVVVADKDTADDIMTFGPFEILGEVARGAMGIVYRARRVGRDEVLALKVLLAGAQATPKQIARFEREADAARRFVHPGIVRIEETGAHQGYHYIAMEYVEGDTLEDRLRKHGPFAPDDAARVIQGLADALICIHDGGVLHRDLKPGNVMLDAKDRPRLIDFGLAKLAQEEKLTRSGATVGTPYYMAPEQVRGQADIGPPADVYALGAILYEMVAGRPPFTGENYGELFGAIVNQPPPPPSSLRPVPPDLEAIILRALAKTPDERFATAAALRDDLGRYLAQEHTEARATARAQGAARAGRRAIAVGLAIVAVLGLAVAIKLAIGRGDQQVKADVERHLEDARRERAAGNHAAAARALSMARGRDPRRADVAYELAVSLIATGERDNALTELEQAVGLGWRKLDGRELEPISSDPRFVKLRGSLRQ